MYAIITLNQNIFIPSKLLNNHLKSTLIAQLITLTEGLPFGNIGSIIMIINIDNKKLAGKILPGFSSVLFKVNFQAVVLKIFKGEIIDAIIKNITSFGIFATAGILNIFISNKFISQDFISQQSQNLFNFKNTTINIKNNDIIRCKILNLKYNTGSIQAIGCIDEKYLGKL